MLKGLANGQFDPLQALPIRPERLEDLGKLVAGTLLANPDII
jgi:hypothetical protein